MKSQQSMEPVYGDEDQQGAADKAGTESVVRHGRSPLQGDHQDSCTGAEGTVT